MSRPAVDQRDQVLEVLKWHVGTLAEEFYEIGPGWYARTHSLPLVHSLNQLRVTVPVTVGEVLAWADECMGDLSFRHVGVEDEATADLLLTSLAGSGWEVERLVVMVLAQEAVFGSEPVSQAVVRPLGAGPVRIVDLSEDEMVGLMRRWSLEEGCDQRAVDDIAEMNRREGRLWGERLLGIKEAGKPVAITKYRSNGSIAWVEDVYTVPEARRQGYARALVASAVSNARGDGHEITFVIADDEDWPKHLYADLGFRPVGFMWNFHRDLD